MLSILERMEYRAIPYLVVEVKLSGSENGRYQPGGAAVYTGR
jgi:hypothetical protein